MTSPRRPAPSSLAWWVRDRDGRLAVAQFPNAAILVWLLAFLARVADTGPVDEETLRAVGRGRSWSGVSTSSSGAPARSAGCWGRWSSPPSWPRCSPEAAWPISPWPAEGRRRRAALHPVSPW